MTDSTLPNFAPITNQMLQPKMTDSTLPIFAPITNQMLADLVKTITTEVSP
jgi:hypothetical protein